jgi:hypothetical protein
MHYYIILQYYYVITLSLLRHYYSGLQYYYISLFLHFLVLLLHYYYQLLQMSLLQNMNYFQLLPLLPVLRITFRGSLQMLKPGPGGTAVVLPAADLECDRRHGDRRTQYSESGYRDYYRDRRDCKPRALKPGPA